jgi:hypothetical protein
LERILESQNRLPSFDSEQTFNEDLDEELNSSQVGNFQSRMLESLNNEEGETSTDVADEFQVDSNLQTKSDAPRNSNLPHPDTFQQRIDFIFKL